MSEPHEIDRRHRAGIRAACVYALVWVTLAASPAALFAYASIVAESPWWFGLVRPRAIVALLLFAWIAFSMTLMLVDMIFGSSICPYFEREVGDIHTFGHGQILVRRHRELDALADRLGVAPFATFGFADDLAGRPVVWHDPATGLATFEALLGALADPACAIARKKPIVADLERIVDALKKARARGIRFSLDYRDGNGTSAQEWQVRKGTAF